MADEDADFEPKAKLKYHGRCWFCREKFKTGKEAIKLEDSGRESFLNDVCSANDDEVGQRTDAKGLDILSGKQEILYHKTCRNPDYKKDELELIKRKSNRKTKFQWKL